MLDALRVHDIQRERSHKQCSVVRHYMQDGLPGMGSDILRRNALFLSACGQCKQRTEHIHSVDILLPDVETSRGEVNCSCFVTDIIVVEIHDYGLGHVA